jgi:hypothetical protein
LEGDEEMADARIGPANSGISTGAKVAMASVFIAPPRRSD